MAVSKDAIRLVCDRLGNDVFLECERLLRSGAVGDNTKICTIIKVALENVADNYAIGDNSDYKNLQRI